MDTSLITLTLAEFTDALADATPAPGGGAATALAGALGAALVAMVAGLTAGRERYAAYDAEMRDLHQRAELLRATLVALVDTDAIAYRTVIAASTLPATTADERAARAAASQSALRRATETPLAVATACGEVLALTAAVIAHGNRQAASDATVAAWLAHAALRGAAWNVRTNLARIVDPTFQAEASQRVAELVAAGEQNLAAATHAADARR